MPYGVSIIQIIPKLFSMICVGIDVAKHKHDCFILSSKSEVLTDAFTTPNNAESFETLLHAVRHCTRPADKIKVGFEATGLYSYNILGFLLNKGLPTHVINSLHIDLYIEKFNPLHYED